MTRRRLLGAVAALLVAGLALALWPLPEELARPRREGSVRLLDRHGARLREVPSSRNGVARWVPLEDMPPTLIEATLLAEDRRFWWHPGVDPLALARSALINLKAGRVLTGGSTLTQQLVRNLLPERPGKAMEALYALRLELRSTKRDLLEAWLNRIPYGRGAYGVGAAAEAWFGKPVGALSPAEAATLAILVRAPESLTFEEIEPLRQDLLRQMSLDPEALRVALAEQVVEAPFTERFAAPHFCDYVLSQLPSGVEEVRTSLDLPLQEAAEDLLRAHLRRLNGQAVGNGAVVVLDVATGGILAMVGSRDYFDSDAGQVNAVLARRQPGSTLKPFLYELGLERGLTAATVLPDLDFHPDGSTDGYFPQNYDWTSHGPVRLRTALACSYNQAAVRTLQELGPPAFLQRLQDLGFASLDREPSHYGLGLTLGDGEVTLLELANAYRALARGGVAGPAQVVTRATAPGVPVLDPAASFVVTDILADPEARSPAFGRHGPLALPFPCASKTGTSKGYRDNWTLGYTPRYVVGVWVGNFGGGAMIDVSGVTGAGPLFRDLMLHLHPPALPVRDFPRPAGLVRAAVCPSSGQRPGPDCPGGMREWFREGTSPAEACDVHRRVNGRVYEVHPPLYRSWMADVGLPLPAGGGWVTRPAADPSPRAEEPEPRAPQPQRLAVAFPEDGATFRLDPILRREYQTLRLRAVVPDGVEQVEWLVDGRSLGRCPSPHTRDWPLTPGRHTITLRTGTEEASVRIEVLD